MSNSTLQQLQAGELTSAFRFSQHQDPITRLQITAHLTELPKEVFDLADCLEVLDLSNNQLTSLPDELDTLVNMRILFLSNNNFDHIPAVLARCPKLEMISFKSNSVISIAEDVLPIDTRWLILTDNKIKALPDSIGKLHRLQKLALAGNRLTDLPASMAQCTSLELARLSANQLTAMPDWLFQLPKLSWLAFSGNTFNRASNTTISSVIDVQLADIELGELLGEGASGLIYRGDWIVRPKSLIDTDNHVAVKVFKGDVTSDGYPQDELDCCLTAGEQENLIKVIAQLDQTDTDKKLGLVMELIPSNFYNLGLPPTLKTCTRDTFNEGTFYDAEKIIKIAKQMANAMTHLHARGVSHGDAYAHNVMINNDADMLLADFGAATNLMTLPKAQQKAMERIEVRAFGCLLDDLLSLCSEVELKENKDLFGLINLKEKCMNHKPSVRPCFVDIQATL